MFETVTSEFAKEVDKNYSIRFGLAVIKVHNVIIRAFKG
jgi:hypothetical protein